MTATDCGLVLQGGGALGAYEWGAVLCLVDKGFAPKVVSGVSIGAINAAAVAGAPDGDIKASLDRIWQAITIATRPFFPPAKQAWTSMFGNPKFWANRSDYMNMAKWTSLCTVDPMRKTLTELVDFGRLNEADKVRIGVNATRLRDATIARFCSTDMKLTPDHILASGALPPGFPEVTIKGEAYWDGGLLNNTPVGTLLGMMTPDECSTMPLFCLDLFPVDSAVPNNLIEVSTRVSEMTYMNKFATLQEQVGDLLQGILGLNEHLQSEAAGRNTPALKKVKHGMKKAMAFANMNVITAPHQAGNAGADFSEHGVKHRRDMGYRAMEGYLDNHRTLASRSSHLEAADPD